MKSKVSRVLFSCAFALSVSSPAFSEPVEMRLPGDDLVIRGDLVSTEGNAAVLSSPKFGVMMIEADRFECSGPGCVKLGRGETFGIRGSNTIGEALTPALIEAYAATQNMRVEKRVGANAEEIEMELFDANGTRVVTIDAQSHGSGTSFPNLKSGAAEIGAASRPIKDSEYKDLTDAGLSVNAHVLALDGIPVIISPSNPVEELTLEQIARIFAGEITDWFQVGGEPGKINVYARDDKSGTYDTFASLVLSPYKLELGADAQRFESSVELSDNVTRDPNGIGFIGFAYLRNAKPLAIGSTCGIVSKATEFAVKTEEYALARRLYYYTTDRLRSRQAKSILEFALSDEAQQTITDTGFINQAIDSLPFGQQGERVASSFTAAPEDFDMEMMKDLVVRLKDAKRLSVTYRFEKNSGELDLKAKQDIQRLARYLKRDDMRGKEILLVGFADSSGPFPTNVTISLGRAASVRDALVAAGGNAIDEARLQVKAYGELMPVDCNTSEDGRAKNRRVEVWVRG